MLKSTRVLLILAGVLLLALASLVYARSQDEPAAKSGWEYLIVADGNVSLTPSGSVGQRKQKDFGREAVTVQKNLDRLGGDGWELVAVGGTPNEPILYLKRPKR
jgi:hypothetical protein